MPSCLHATKCVHCCHLLGGSIVVCKYGALSWWPPLFKLIWRVLCSQNWRDLPCLPPFLCRLLSSKAVGLAVVGLCIVLCLVSHDCRSYASLQAAHFVGGSAWWAVLLARCHPLPPPFEVSSQIEKKKLWFFCPLLIFREHFSCVFSSVWRRSRAVHRLVREPVSFPLVFFFSYPLPTFAVVRLSTYCRYIEPRKISAQRLSCVHRSFVSAQHVPGNLDQYSFVRPVLHLCTFQGALLQAHLCDCGKLFDWREKRCKSRSVCCGHFSVRCLRIARGQICDLARKICWILMICFCWSWVYVKCDCVRCLDSRCLPQNFHFSPIGLALLESFSAPWRNEISFLSNHEMISQHCWYAWCQSALKGYQVPYWMRLRQWTPISLFTFGATNLCCWCTGFLIAISSTRFISSVTAHLTFVSFVHNHAGSHYVFIHHSHPSCPCVHEW